MRNLSWLPDTAGGPVEAVPAPVPEARSPQPAARSPQPAARSPQPAARISKGLPIAAPQIG